jgi:hypothetical protein
MADGVHDRRADGPGRALAPGRVARPGRDDRGGTVTEQPGSDQDGRGGVVALEGERT